MIHDLKETNRESDQCGSKCSRLHCNKRRQRQRQQQQNQPNETIYKMQSLNFVWQYSDGKKIPIEKICCNVNRYFIAYY